VKRKKRADRSVLDGLCDQLAKYSNVWIILATYITDTLTHNLDMELPSTILLCIIRWQPMHKEMIPIISNEVIIIL
jgi:hypothetical protein